MTKVPVTGGAKNPDSTKAKNDLKFTLTIAPEENIPKTVEWSKRSYSTE